MYELSIDQSSDLSITSVVRENKVREGGGEATKDDSVCEIPFEMKSTSISQSPFGR